MTNNASRVPVTVLSREIQQFAALMQTKLNENQDKGGWKGVDFSPFGEGRGQVWREKNDYLLRRLDEEIAELKAAVYAFDASPLAIAREAADVANFAMMLADVQ